jgi:secondary thiamine-phosphate synthase enzyme
LFKALREDAALVERRENEVAVQSHHHGLRPRVGRLLLLLWPLRLGVRNGSRARRQRGREQKPRRDGDMMITSAHRWPPRRPIPLESEPRAQDRVRIIADPCDRSNSVANSTGSGTKIGTPEALHGWKQFRPAPPPRPGGCATMRPGRASVGRAMEWVQKHITLSPRPRGFHLVTSEVESKTPEIRRFRVGLAHVFIQHTSASLTVNENADPSVRDDMESYFNDVVPEDAPYYVHTAEGPDDMPAHLKSAILGSGVLIPVRDGRLDLGTWQGIYLCEHRHRGGGRRVVVTLMGVIA